MWVCSSCVQDRVFSPPVARVGMRMVILRHTAGIDFRGGVAFVGMLVVITLQHGFGGIAGIRVLVGGVGRFAGIRIAGIGMRMAFIRAGQLRAIRCVHMLRAGQIRGGRIARICMLVHLLHNCAGERLFGLLAGFGMNMVILRYATGQNALRGVTLLRMTMLLYLAVSHQLRRTRREHDGIAAQQTDRQQHADDPVAQL